MNVRKRSAVSNVVSLAFALLTLLCCFGSRTRCYAQSAVTKTTAIVHYRTADSGWLSDTGDGALIIPVLVNGYHARFLFDTGTPDILVTDEFVQRMAAMRRFSMFETGIDEPQPETTKPKPLTVQVGSLNFTEGVQTVKNIDLSGLIHTHVDGILGKSAIDHAAVLLSPAHDTLTFYVPGNLTPHDRETMGMGGAVAVPLKLTSDQLLSVAATFTHKADTVTEDLLIDTGAKNTVISESSFKELGGTVLSNAMIETVWGNEDTTTFTIDQAALGSLILDGPVLSYTANRRIQVPVVLGRDILSKYKILIDPPAMMMYLLPNGTTRSTETGLR